MGYVFGNAIKAATGWVPPPPPTREEKIQGLKQLYIDGEITVVSLDIEIGHLPLREKQCLTF